MATIINGYNDMPLRINVNRRHESTGLELWIELGIPRILGHKGAERIANPKDLKDGETYVPTIDTLSCMTLDEALTLRNELNKAIKEAVGL